MFDNIKQKVGDYFSGKPTQGSKRRIYTISRKDAADKGYEGRDQLRLAKHYYQRGVKARTAINSVARPMIAGAGAGLLYRGVKSALTKTPTLESQILEMQLNIFKYNKIKCNS